MRTITVVTATRAEYGLLRPVVQKIAASDVLDLQLVVTGAHLCPRLGETVHEIEADGLPIAARLPIFTDNPDEPVAKTIARTMEIFDNYFAAHRPDAVLLRASWMYDLPGYGLPIRGNLPLNLLRAALQREALRFSRNDHRGVTYVRQVIENLEPAMTLPGGVYNFGSGNAENMVCTARQFAETLGIAVQIEEESWGRNLVMDTTKLERFGIRFDTTQQGIQRCLKDYGLRTL